MDECPPARSRRVPRGNHRVTRNGSLSARYSSNSRSSPALRSRHICRIARSSATRQYPGEISGAARSTASRTTVAGGELLLAVQRRSPRRTSRHRCGVWPAKNRYPRRDSWSTTLQLHPGPVLQVGASPRGRKIQKEEAPVVPDPNRALGRDAPYGRPPGRRNAMKRAGSPLDGEGTGSRRGARQEAKSRIRGCEAARVRGQLGPKELDYRPPDGPRRPLRLGRPARAAAQPRQVAGAVVPPAGDQAELGGLPCPPIAPDRD